MNGEVPHRLEIKHRTFDALTDAGLEYASYLMLRRVFSDPEVCLAAAVRMVDNLSERPVAAQQEFIDTVAGLYAHAFGQYPPYYLDGYQRIRLSK